MKKFLPMTGFEPRTSDIGSNRSTNWATTTAHGVDYLNVQNYSLYLCKDSFCSSGKSDTQFTLVNYDSRVVLTCKLILFMTLDW